MNKTLFLFLLLPATAFQSCFHAGKSDILLQNPTCEYAHDPLGIDAIEQTGGYTFRLTRSQQTPDEFNTVLKIAVRQKPLKSSGDILIRRIIY